MSVTTLEAAARYGQPLTHRELQVLQLITDGLTDDRIATRLHVSAHTVKSHLRRIYGKLGARTRAHAVSLAYRKRVLLVPTPSPSPAVPPPVSEQAALVRRWVESGKAQIVRRGAGLSRAQVGADCGVSAARVADWESGVARPSGAHVEAYFGALTAMARAAGQVAA